MPYLFTCPHCQSKTLVEDRFSGHIGRCATCDGKIEVPHFVMSSASSTSQPVPQDHIGLTTRRIIASIVGLLIVIGLGGVLIRYATPAVTKLSAVRQRTQTIRNLEQIAAALNAYAADHGAYPAPVVRDASGMPMHSWRVAILPYLNESQLYVSYDFNQPWNSPSNSLIVGSMPSVYASPHISGFSSNQSHYQLVSGDTTLFPRTGPLGPKKLLDEAAKTALVVEAFPTPNSSAVWTEPVELDINAMSFVMGANPGVEIGGVTEGGVGIATVDGEGHFLEETTTPEIIRAILTASGGEPLADDVLD